MFFFQGYGRAYFSATSAHTCTGDGNAMVARAGTGMIMFDLVLVNYAWKFGASFFQVALH